MGSIAQKINAIRRNGESLPESAIKQLRASVKGEVLFRGDAAEVVYRKAIDRFNKATVTEAVDPFIL
jgi:hypothetical protein